MNTTREQISPNHLRLIISVEPEDYLNKVDNEIKSLSKKISIDGFRPGKVPPGITKKLYGNTVLAEELNKMLSDSVNTYIKDNQLRIIGQPLPFQVTHQHIDLQQPTGYSFGFEVGLMPEFEIPQPSKTFEKKILRVTEKMVDDEIDRLRSKFGDREYPDETGEEDILAGRFEELNEEGSVKDGGVNSTSSFSLRLIKDEVSKQLLTNLKKEEATDINPWSAFGNDEELIIHRILRTDHHQAEQMSHRFRFTLTNVIRIKKADIDQSFYDKVYGEGKITNEEQMRERITNEMQREFQSVTDSKLNHEIQQYLISETPIDFPLDFLRRLLKENAEDPETPITEQQLSNALHQLKWESIADRLIKENQITTEAEEIKAEATKDVINYFGGNAAISENPESLDELVNSLLNDQETSSRLKTRVMNEKLFALLRGKFNSEEKEVDEHAFFHHKKTHKQ